MPPRLLLFSAADPALDLALEEAIHLEVDGGRSANTWRLWQPDRTAIILGAGLRSAREANLERAAARAVPVLRRHSGGGAVVVGAGTIQYSAFYLFADLPGSGTIRGATSAALAPIIQSLKRFSVEAFEAGSSDLVVNDGNAVKKIAGNSQSRKRNSVLVHGTLLARPDWAEIDRLLPLPSKMPEYRSGRAHGDFLVSARDLGISMDAASFAEALAAVLPGVRIATHPTEDEWRLACELAREKYSDPAWNLRW